MSSVNKIKSENKETAIFLVYIVVTNAHIQTHPQTTHVKIEMQTYLNVFQKNQFGIRNKAMPKNTTTEKRKFINWLVEWKVNHSN